MKKDIKFKEKEIIEILNEMKLDKLKESGFTDLLIETCIKNKYYESFERCGSSDGFKTIMQYPIEKTSYRTQRYRLNDVSVEDSFIKDDMLTIIYERNKKITFKLDIVAKVFIMKQNDDRIY